MSDPHGEPKVESSDPNWGVDAAIGAASVAAKVAGGVASTVVSSGPGRAVEGVARWFTQPLSREGQAVREQLADEGVPAARDTVRRLTPGIVDAVDLDAILSAVDVQGIISRVDINEIVSQVDIDGIISKVDIDGIISKVDIDALIGRLDLDALIGRLDLDALIGRLDLNAVLAKLDLNALVGQLDLNALLDNLDINAVVDQLDIDALMSNTEMGGLIARSTTGIASEALDSVRSQGVTMDSVIARIANRLLRRDIDELPAGPQLLVEHQLALPSGDPSTTRVGTVDPIAPADSEIDDGSSR